MSDDTQRTITCPSGMKGIIQKISVRDLKQLASLEDRKNPHAVLNIIKSCWVRTIDPGPYRAIELPDGDLEVDWRQVLTGDEVEISMAIYDLCWGGTWRYKSRCEWCARPSTQDFTLTDREVKYLSEEGRRKVSGGEFFECTIGVGETEQTVQYVLGNIGMVIDFIRKAGRGKKAEQEAQTEMYVRRIKGLPGHKGTTGSAGGDVKEWIENLNSDDFDELEIALEEEDCGVETKVGIYCPHCRTSGEGDLPLGKLFSGESRTKAAEARRRKRRLAKQKDKNSA